MRLHYTWESSDEAIATVSENGLVTLVASGVVEITATAHNGVTATCTLTANALTIVEAQQFENVTAYQGDEAELPATVALTLSDGSTQEMPITWNGYDNNQLGEQTLTGSYELPENVEGEAPTVTLTVTVLEKLTITAIQQFDDVFIESDADGHLVDIPELPATATLTLSDGSTREVALIWDIVLDDYLTDTIATGDYELPPDLDGKIQAKRRYYTYFEEIVDIATIPGITPYYLQFGFAGVSNNTVGISYTSSKMKARGAGVVLQFASHTGPGGEGQYFTVDLNGTRQYGSNSTKKFVWRSHSFVASDENYEGPTTFSIRKGLPPGAYYSYWFYFKNVKLTKGTPQE